VRELHERERERERERESERDGEGAELPLFSQSRSENDNERERGERGLADRNRDTLLPAIAAFLQLSPFLPHMAS